MQNLRHEAADFISRPRPINFQARIYRKIRVMRHFKPFAPSASGKLPTGVKAAILGASVMILSACATTTPYQEATKPGSFDGYSQTVIENDRARVSFAGNSLTERETVENYLLYRAAELTSERGFDHFTLIESDTEKKTRLRSTGTGFSNGGFGFHDPFFRYSYFSPRFGWSRFGRFSSFNRFGVSRFGGRGFGRRGFGGRGGFGFGGGFNSFDVREITKYRATAEVKFGRGAAPDEDRSFDAREVLQNLGPTIVYPEASQDKVITPEVVGNDI